MAEYIDKSEIYRRYFDGGCGVVRMHVSDIDIIPAADFVQVVHGRWNNRKVQGINYRICSVCGEYRPALNEFGKVAKRRYCPNCGAKMDLD